MVLLLVFHPGQIFQQAGSVKDWEGLDGTLYFTGNPNAHVSIEVNEAEPCLAHGNRPCTPQM
jgi:hypothetical protein